MNTIIRYLMVQRYAYAKVEEIVEKFLQNHFTLKNSLQVLREDRLFQLYTKTILSEFSAIHSAAWFGLDDCILGLLRDTFLVDSRDDDGQTALHWATRNGQISTVKLLLRHGFGVNLVDREGKSALHHAINHGQEALLRVLVDNGANIELADNRGQTPFLNAVENMAVNAAQILLKMGAKAGALNFMKQNSLHLATLGREDEALRMTTILFSHRNCPNPSASDLNNMTPLHYSVARSHQKLSTMLLQNGADINIGVQRSPADNRTGNHHMPECKLQANPRRTSNAHNIYGLTPLHFAALVGNSAMTKFVLSKGANVNAHCQNGDTPLHLALRKAVLDLDEVPPSKVSDLKLINIPRIQDAWSDNNWKIECLKYIIDDREDDKAAEIFHTILEERMNVLDALVTHPDINVNLVNRNQETPMHLIPFGQDESVTILTKLVNKSAQMCVRNKKAQTPLHIACLKGDYEIAYETLRLDPSSAFECDLQGHYSLHCALRSQDCELVDMLLDHFDKYDRSACTEVKGKGNNLLHFRTRAR
jgi:ankyrin repeat protein